MRVLVTGHVGFIGSHFVKHLLDYSDAEVIGFSRWSEQKNLRRLVCHSRLQDVWGDLREVSGLCEGVDVVVNFAAKTFVDHSILDDGPFLESNVVGARNLMLDAKRYGVERFVQVSTDEVYGQILTGAYKEEALLQPRNPYAWSKAAADLYAITLHRMHGFPVIITRTENNFGPWQHRQKALPTFVRAALRGEPLPVYGDGLHVRCWLHVEEHCRAIWHLVKYSLMPQCGHKHVRSELQEVDCGPGRRYRAQVCNLCGGATTDPLGEVFHIAGEQEMTNIDLARLVLRTLGKLETAIRYVPDHNVRPGHDRRYALDCSKLRATGFTVSQDLEARLAETVRWYAEHPEWTK